MDSELFVQNVKELCAQKGVKPTNACKESGVGASFLSDIARGQTPSVAKVQTLARYLGVTTSQLLGEEVSPSAWADELYESFRDLTPEEQADTLAYVAFLKSRRHKP